MARTEPENVGERTAAALRKLETVSTIEALEYDLEQRILEGELVAGDHLREVELAEEYGVGRHTLRAAFDGLVHRGLLQKARNRGVFVRVLTERDLREIYELRTALEVEAFRALAHRGGDVPPAARAAAEHLKALGQRAAQREVVEADFDFHRAVVDGVGNERLSRAHEQLRAEMRLCLAQLVNRYASVGELAKEHRELLERIELGDPATAEDAIRGHLERAVVWLVENGAGRRGSPPTA